MTRRASKKMIIAVTIGGVLLVLLLITIGVIKEGEGGSHTYQIMLIPKTIDESNDFWTSLIEGARLGAEELGADIYITGGTSEDDYEKQNRLIEEAIKLRPDALLIAPCSYSETTEKIQEAVNAGITVILVDSVVDQDVAQGIVATDSFKAGEELGAYTRNMLKTESRIGIVAHVKGTSTATERAEGIRSGLGEDAYRIKEMVYCNSSYQLASDLTKQMLKENPDIDILIGTNEYAAVGAARAVSEMELAGKVKVVGFDNSVEQIQFLEAGVFQGIVIQKPFNIGYLGVEQAVKALQGYPIEYYLDSGCKLITRTNMYEEENQRLLYPFSGQQ